MPRPCSGQHELLPGRCRYCYWCVSNSTEGMAYRRLWGEPEPETYPSILQQGWRIAVAAWKNVLGGLSKVPLAVYNARRETCEGCSSYRPDDDRCVECGCFLDLKLHFEREECPLGKWKKADDSRALITADIADPMGRIEPGDNKKDWAKDWVVRDAHVAALGILIERQLPEPAGLAGEGIVTCGGGKYWPMILLSIRMARKFTDLPIQVWRNGEHESINVDDLDGLGDVTIRDVLEVNPRPRRSGGWENKTTAIIHSGFEKVLFLDADAYLVSSPTTIFELLSTERIVFWKDLPWNAQTVSWEWYDVTNETRVPSVQGGQLGINVRTFWRELVISHWIGQHSDYFFSHQYGDQDSWRIALAATKGSYHVVGDAQWVWPAFVCTVGQTTVIHRCQGKWWAEGRSGFNHQLPGETMARKVHEEVFLKKGKAEDVFSSIYDRGEWGERESSGAGSSPAEAKPYLHLVNSLIRLGGIRSVADLGCGDGYITERIEAPHVFGVECCYKHVARLRADVPVIAWHHLDLDTNRDALPCADLALVKDVMHHWPSALIVNWITWARECGKWRWVLLTNDVHQKTDGEDIQLGGYRALHPEQAPLVGLDLTIVGEYLHKCVLALECRRDR